MLVSLSTLLSKENINGLAPDVVLVVVWSNHILDLKRAVDFLCKSGGVRFRRPGPGHGNTKSTKMVTYKGCVAK